jgi:hypothetical protein
MKNKGRIFLVLMIFAVANGFGQQNADDINNEILERIKKLEAMMLPLTGGVAQQGRLTALTFDIIGDIESNNLQELHYYLSADMTVTDMSESKIGTSGGGAVRSGKTTEIVFPSKNYGKCEEFNTQTAGKEFFMIKFPGTEQLLKFVRNPKTDRFDFFPEGKLKSSSRPFLRIRVIEPVSRTEPLQNDTEWVAAGLSGTNQYPVYYITGKGRLRPDVIVSYIASKGSKIMNRHQIINLVNLYIAEAEDEEINHDIAIAQMCYATRYLNNRQLLDTRNYAGLNTDIGISFAKNPQKHYGQLEGVRAHIQHLKGYAGGRLTHGLVDRRYNLLKTKGYFGTIKTLDELSARWSPYNAVGYEREIRRILRELNQYSGRI